MLSYGRDSEGISRQSQATLASQSDVWGMLPLRFESELTAQKLEIWRLWGLSEEFGPVGNNSTGECAGREIIDELTGFLVRRHGSPPAPAEVSVAPAKSHDPLFGHRDYSQFIFKVRRPTQPQMMRITPHG